MMRKEKRSGQSLWREARRLSRPFWRVIAASTVLGIVGGLATVVLLAQINQGLHGPRAIDLRFLLAFAGLCGLTIIGRAVAGAGNSLVGQKVIAAMRKDVSARIVCAPIEAIEQYRIHRLLATLSGDVETISVFTFNAANYAVVLAVTAGCCAYLLTLSPRLFLLAGGAMVGGGTATHYARRAWMQDYAIVRDAQDALQKQYSAITQGAKELRVDRALRRRVFGNLLCGAVDQIADRKNHAMRLFWVADAIDSSLFFLVIGGLLLLRARLALAPDVVSGFVIVLLYAKGPLDHLTSALPAFGEAQIAFRRVVELSAAFRTQEPSLLAAEGTIPSMPDSIALSGVSYTYPARKNVSSFMVGPFDIEIRRGEILFIVGDNGSGKTTLIKLLLGLYPPQTGHISIGGQSVTDAIRDDYRQLFATVFADYYLFDDGAASFPGRDAERYLERLDLAHKVTPQDGGFSTTDLSTGQRKRLALINAWLSDRPVLVFDEWAADQDPEFRHMFYTDLLPDLRRQGRTLVVISHDDRYFGIADRVLRMKGGQIVAEKVDAGTTGFSSTTRD